MNTRVFKDVGKYQHKTWLGFTTRQMLFVLPGIALTAFILLVNVFVWGFGDWFTYSIIFGFTCPMMMLGTYRPQNLSFETYLKYRLNWEMRIPVRRTNTGGHHEIVSKKTKTIKEYDYKVQKG